MKLTDIVEIIKKNIPLNYEEKQALAYIVYDSDVTAPSKSLVNLVSLLQNKPVFNYEDRQALGYIAKDYDVTDTLSLLFTLLTNKFEG